MRTSSENVISRFCNHLSIIQSHYAWKMRFNYPGIKLEPALGTRQNWTIVIICSRHVVHTTAKKVISRHWKNENVFKMWKDEKCKACTNNVFHCPICKFVGFLLTLSSWLLELPSLAPCKEPNLFLHTKNGNHSSLRSCYFRSTTAIRRSLRQRFLN